MKTNTLFGYRRAAEKRKEFTVGQAGEQNGQHRQMEAQAGSRLVSFVSNG